MRFVFAALILMAIALAGYGTVMQVRANQAVAAVAERMEADGDYRPRLDTPISRLENFQVNCSSMDGGAPVSCLTPMDGGTTGIERPASSVYVAPIAGASVKIRVGGSDVTQNLGFELGPSARDGVGLSVDARHSWCISEGAAQRADVVVGRQ